MDPRQFCLKDGRSLTVTPATHDHARELIEFLPSALAESDGLIMTGSEFHTAAGTESDVVGKLATSSTRLVLVGLVDHRIVAVATCTCRNLERVRHAGEVGLMVGQDYWGLGIGSSMMEVLRAWAIECPEITKLDLRVRPANRRAIRLYERMGFQMEGWIRRAVRVGENYDDHYWMGLELPTTVGSEPISSA